MFFSQKRICWMLVILFVASQSFISCDSEDPEVKATGEISFSFAAASASRGRTQSGEAKSILVTIQDNNGTLVHNRTKLTLYKFSSEFLSEPLALNVGAYKLTEFIVLNENDEVMLITPIENSDMAYIVSAALPIDINITKDQVTKVVPEVIKTEGHVGAEFGYATFSFQIVNTLNFLSAAFAYDAPSHSLKLTSHRMVVKSGSEILFDGFMADITSSTRVRSNFENYTITFFKDGYNNVEKTLSKSQLMAFGTTPLVVVFHNDALTEGLVAHYTFADGLASDLTGNGNNGVITGAVATADADGHVNEAIAFSSADDRILVQNPTFINNNQGTFTAWVKFDNFGHVQYVGSVADENSVESYISFLRVDTNGKVGVYEREPTLANWVVGTTQLNVNEYYHLALVSTGSEWKIFINGTEETLEVVNGSNNGNWISDLAGIDNFAIGNLVMQQPYDVPSLSGKIDEVRVYSRPLSANEIKELYLSTN